MPLTEAETLAYEHAYRLAAIADDIRDHLRAIDTGVYEGRLPDRSLTGNAAPIRTPQDHENVVRAIHGHLRQARASLTIAEASMGMGRGLRRVAEK